MLRIQIHRVNVCGPLGLLVLHGLAATLLAIAQCERAVAEYFDHGVSAAILRGTFENCPTLDEDLLTGSKVRSNLAHVQ